jgi:hypothetical protein
MNDQSQAPVDGTLAKQFETEVLVTGVADSVTQNTPEGQTPGTLGAVRDGLCAPTTPQA